MESDSALAGVKVLDFSQVGAGPLVTKYLADHGATVVSIESITHPDSTRTSFPYKDGVPGVNRSAPHLQMSSSKYSFGLNMRTGRSLAVAKRLVAWADIVVEGFRPGLMGRWGLSYEQLRAVKPDVIMLSTSMQGQTGPRSNMVGFGFTLKGLSGFVDTVGWPDRDGVGVPLAYTDHIAPWYSVAALMAALEYRRRTGKGQYIDISQYEAGLQFIAAPLLDYTANGRVRGRRGNRSECGCPHGVFRCIGDDRWVAIAVFNNRVWRSFCHVIGNPQWSRESRFDLPLGRKENEDELERLVEAWTVTHSDAEVMSAMQTNRVPAGAVQTSEDLYRDPQLEHRHYFWSLQHREMGTIHQPSWPGKLSKTPAQLRVSPCLGEHTLYVCRELLGMGDDEVSMLVSEGTLELG